jgi:polyferredoxin
VKDIWYFVSGPANLSLTGYRLFVDVWLVGILPVTLYPFFGGKVWCRYWCPLAKMMQIMSKFYTRIGISKFHIYSNDKCIACNECSRNCQVGIDVMSYALKEEVLDNRDSSCIGCGICVTVCPMDVLTFKDETEQGKDSNGISH